MTRDSESLSPGRRLIIAGVIAASHLVIRTRHDAGTGSLPVSRLESQAEAGSVPLAVGLPGSAGVPAPAAEYSDTVLDSNYYDDI